MAYSSLNEELDEVAAEEQRKAERFNDLNQRQRRISAAAKLARAGSKVARALGQEELADFAGQLGGEGNQPGGARSLGSNKAGRSASKLAQSKYGASKGQGAAVGGAVSGALQGEGASGIAKSAISWYVLDLVFASLFTIVGFIPALIYLDLHFIFNKLGSKLFGAMSLWQKLLLLAANLIAALIPLAFVLLIYTASCGNVLGSTLSTAAHYGSFGYFKDICAAFEGTQGGGRSGGAGASGTFGGWEPSDLVALTVTVDDQASDKRVRQCMLGRVQNIFAAAQAAGLTLTVTSAFRSGNFPSRHAYGEAVDIAIRPSPGDPPNKTATQAQIAKLVQIAKSAGFTPPAGDTIDEYNNPTEQTTGGHVHIEFNKKSATESYCAPYSNPPAPFT